MGNHYHLLVTPQEEKCQTATDNELLKRYQKIYGKGNEPPAGSYLKNGEIDPDPDGGIERLRSRLGDISRFVQELNQGFAVYYNHKYDRKGSLWHERFKGVPVQHGVGGLAVSSYIDLNPIRAGMVERPEDYRWCGLGYRVRHGQTAERFLRPLPQMRGDDGVVGLGFYRTFVYEAGALESDKGISISPDLVSRVKNLHGELGIGDRLRYRIRNFSEGLGVGGVDFISQIQREYGRKFIRPRKVLGDFLYSTRLLGMKPDL